MRCVRKVTSALMLGRCGRRVALVVVLCRVQFGVRSPVDAVEPLAAGAPKYIAITPFRLADTRPSEGAYGFTVVNSNTIRINVTGRPGVPSNASAAVVNIALINANGGGYITAYPSGTKLPTTATSTPTQLVAPSPILRMSRSELAAPSMSREWSELMSRSTSWRCTYRSQVRLPVVVSRRSRVGQFECSTPV